MECGGGGREVLWFEGESDAKVQSQALLCGTVGVVPVLAAHNNPTSCSPGGNKARVVWSDDLKCSMGRGVPQWNVVVEGCRAGEKGKVGEDEREERREGWRSVGEGN